jgi:hypothetical protein
VIFFSFLPVHSFLLAKDFGPQLVMDGLLYISKLSIQIFGLPNNHLRLFLIVRETWLLVIVDVEACIKQLPRLLIHVLLMLSLIYWVFFLVWCVQVIASFFALVHRVAPASCLPPDSTTCARNIFHPREASIVLVIIILLFLLLRIFIVPVIIETVIKMENTLAVIIVIICIASVSHSGISVHGLLNDCSEKFILN